MKYIMLICADEKLDEGLSQEQMAAVYGEYYAYTEELRKAGAYVAGEPLEPTSTATTVRVRNSEVLTTDGPFAETKEQMGGFYIIDVANLDEAIRWASKIPHARQGCIEVRPIANMT